MIRTDREVRSEGGTTLERAVKGLIHLRRGSADSRELTFRPAYFHKFFQLYFCGLMYLYEYNILNRYL